MDIISECLGEKEQGIIEKSNQDQEYLEIIREKEELIQKFNQEINKFMEA